VDGVNGLSTTQNKTWTAISGRDNPGVPAARFVRGGRNGAAGSEFDRTLHEGSSDGLP
jgi:hypothetical protein